MHNLNDLLVWLEYGRESGYVAAREPKEQEEHWASLLRKEMEAKASLLAALEGLLPIMQAQVPPEIGGWNWPAMARDVEAALAKAKE